MQSTTKRSKKLLVFMIVDDMNVGWGVAPTKLDARQQMAWFLPHGKKYHIEPYVINEDIDDE